MSRQLKLTPDLHANVVKMIRAGVHPLTACAAEGIHRATYFDWRKRGQAGEEPFEEFLFETDRALAEVNGRLEQSVIRAADQDWRAGAWALSRRVRDVYGDKQAIDLNVEPKHEFRPLTDEVAEEIRRKILYGERSARPPAVPGRDPPKPTEA